MSTTTAMPALPDEEALLAAAAFERMAAGIQAAARCDPATVRLILTAFAAGGHVLLEDLPGMGKTTLARALAAVTGGKIGRVQCTPDLLPSDVTGVTIFNERSREFEFHPGPVFANVVIVDEINRTSPKTQSALLEVMQEGRITVDGKAHPVPRPFLVVATQNPIDLEGTFPLPEAQLDRFLMRLSLGYPGEEAELSLLRGSSLTEPEDLAPVLIGEEMARLGAAAERVAVAESVNQYVLRLAQRTRRDPRLRAGVSLRGSIALCRTARIYALADGRGYVTPDDVKALARPVWAHRLVPLSGAAGSAETAELLDGVLAEVPVPAPQGNG
ncbi:MoxR family ATPase [Actinomadura sp. NPDC048955]|uniref:MoxR-like ATPase n=1 Tax=Actinomadura luteofluorescens TaxID=46163 RepID=A0A7Y9EJG1_9ACTN|nr:MoxR family ATPase [Actinomadura luteofluorescens]NYD48794.1 MoxR-like ATPase [Actinomadura luteofluorescens]